jgi:transposase
VPDGLRERIEPLLPKKPCRFPYPGRKPLDDRKVLQGVLFVLHTGIGWEHLPQELGFGCEMTAWRRLRSWRRAGVWEKLHALLLAELRTSADHVVAYTRPDHAVSIKLMETLGFRIRSFGRGRDDEPAAVYTLFQSG